jgi:hypothetical protein
MQKLRFMQNNSLYEVRLQRISTPKASQEASVLGLSAEAPRDASSSQSISSFSSGLLLLLAKSSANFQNIFDMLHEVS